MWLVHLIGVIVPRRLRADWRAEWQAELRHRELMLAEWERLDWHYKFDLLRRSLGAFWDALLLQPRRLEDEMFQDLRFGARMLFKHKSFTIVALLTLALGIGVNTTVYTYINAVMNRIITFAEPDRVVFVWSSNRASEALQNPVSELDYLDWRAQTESFSSLAAFSGDTRTLTGDGVPERVSSLRVTPNFFPTLGIQSERGRVFLPDEDRAEASRVVVLGHQFWQRRFAGDPNIIGQTIVLDGATVTVIGITPADFRFYEESDVWEPLVFTPQQADRNRRALIVVGRLNPGVTEAQAAAELDGVTARLAEQFPTTNAGWNAQVLGVREVLWGPEGRLAFTLLMGVVLAVLLIACANIANLQLARAAARQKEVAVRLALGAHRWRLIRQLLTENLLLALGGGVFGMGLAYWGIKLVNAKYGSVLPLLNEAVIDGRVLGYTTLLVLIAVLAFGLAPAWQATRPVLNEALKEGGRGAAQGPRAHRMRKGLIVAEIALSLMLLVVAGLMIRTVINFQRVEPGFETSQLLTLRVALPERDYGTDEQVRDFYRRVQSELQTQPGIQAVGAINRLPLAGSSRNARRTLAIEGRPVADPNDKPWAIDLVVTPGYFEALGIWLRAGRTLTAQDSATAQRVAVISETMARKYWPNGDALGQRFKLERSAAADNQAAVDWVAIVGVVNDVRNDDVNNPPLPQIYFPHAQQPVRELSIAVRTAGAPLDFIAAVRQAARNVDPKLPVFEVRSMDQLLFEDLAGSSIVAELLGVFALLALALAAVGIYGVMSYSVAERTNEIGVRLALGAQRRQVLVLVLKHGAKLTALGIGIGLLGALALAQLVKSLLFGIGATDPLTFTAITLVLAGAALLASYIPAQRATRINPLVALRRE